ncbi:2-dehydropantoate 2-reductase [Bermanella marisrubri]|uniref:2-dehydropantoate 2-reductase n=1 Tax=Bermanella marisrubri TaxID=207949 RepID=Q1MXS5_9GAMM|nr:2-dehydropantoate 2-reductase [Bermanella marisrubri]EAT10776.1 2-dehydropantoate 2-reductase [Oceanobacter sp. RED65] [Bermanella marisrubri]QIZ83483.1 2-dehydropantoate 2-reductase [Bermanella marisrubri]
MLNIHILGTGAIGSLWGSYFATDTNDQNYSLTFISRSIQENQYRYHLAPEDRWIQGRCINAQRQSKAESIRYLIVTCKAYDALQAMEQIQDLLMEPCHIVLLQNGMGSQQAITKAYPQHAIYACSSTEGAYKSDVHHLIHAGKGQNLLGPMNTIAKQIGQPTWIPDNTYQYTHDINTALWRKLIINCAINPLTALYQCRNGQLIEHEPYHQHLKRICAELQPLISHQQLDIDDAYDLARHVCEITAQNQSSMLQDKLNNKRSELAYITGFAIRSLEESGLTNEENNRLYHALKQQSLKD